MLNSAVKSIAARAGFEVIASWRVANLSYTRRMQALFEHFGITEVIDVGANAGQFRDQMRDEVGFSGPIYSFEPDPTLAASLARRAAADPAWTVFPMALGASAGTMRLNLMKNPVYNSFHIPSLAEADHCGNGNQVVRTVDVDMRTLDGIASKFPHLAHTYIKVDTQGFDLEVLKGGQIVVSQVPALQTEVSLRKPYGDGPSMEDSISAFTEFCFAIADFFLVAAHAGQRAIKFDCIMVRDDQAT